MTQNKKDILILTPKQRVGEPKQPTKLKDEINELILSEQVRSSMPISSVFSDDEVAGMIKDYDRTINKSDSERRLLNAARSTIFIASFGIPAVMGRFMNTGSPIMDGIGAAGLFIIGGFVSSRLSKEFRDRQLRDVAVADYAEIKLCDLANKKFMQSHHKRMHKELLDHLNEKIDFKTLGTDKLQKASQASFLLAIGFVFAVNVAPLFQSEDDINQDGFFEELNKTIDNAIEDFFEENIFVVKPKVTAPEGS